ncbi:phosphoribosylformylglycinamidine synthase subunit PurS [Parvularcula sp. LCG005]|uniref:phosphoribosylformylglycinamidine synthase subunit PurS n=1 Tax=Parvularcula sp. LCG005 TaxID=3078805 RepID=UPI0029437CD7|nr:phosphoribosylformylglycinamidine synthase subunit PurS [Parvularcula sp. LCG005]WOI52539.1 phosphoribosylformylglycinamidine synthase subunit PurS [Parvularcula sp. LCG005]
MKAKIHVSLKTGVLDPQGKAIETSLHSLGFDGAQNVRQGKLIEIDLPTDDQAEAQKLVDEMCSKLLANPVMEKYTVEFVS